MQQLTRVHGMYDADDSCQQQVVCYAECNAINSFWCCCMFVQSHLLAVVAVVPWVVWLAAAAPKQYSSLLAPPVDVQLVAAALLPPG